jgi:SAM-dependent methyltransferase
MLALLSVTSTGDPIVPAVHVDPAREHEFGLDDGRAFVSFPPADGAERHVAVFVEAHGCQGDADDLRLAAGVLARALPLVFQISSGPATGETAELTLRLSHVSTSTDLSLVVRRFPPESWLCTLDRDLVDANHPEWGDFGRAILNIRGIASVAEAVESLCGLLRDIASGPTIVADSTERLKGPLPARPGLARHRLEAVTGMVRRSNAARVIDLGCGNGILVAALAGNTQYRKIVGVDIDEQALGTAHRRMHLDWLPSYQRDRVSFVHRSLFDGDPDLDGFDTAVLMEVIEHFDLSQVSKLMDVIMGPGSYRTIIVTTPNGEHTLRFPGPAGGPLRHDGHRFEFSRSAFRAWAKGIEDRYGYRAEFQDIGEVDPVVGAPTLAAQFRMANAPERGGPRTGQHQTSPD